MRPDRPVEKQLVATILSRADAKNPVLRSRTPSHVGAADQQLFALRGDDRPTL